jgi:4-diphosphocytidyl-2-C-methyl-D-erythritol kinase
MDIQIIKSYAKVNLSLEILKKEKNFHVLQTVICCLQHYYDVLTISPATKFDVESSGKYLFNGDNILEKVAFLCKKEFDCNINFNVKIQKNIKTGGGLGGGSSNAATFLHFLLKQNNIYLNQKAFCEFAFKIGADVPFFFNHYPKICKNYGEVLSDLTFNIPNNLFVVIVVPDFEVKTKEVFSFLNHSQFQPKSKFINFDDVVKSQNPFLNIALQLKPNVKEVLESLLQIEGCIKVDISGSGSCFFGLFTKEVNLKMLKAKFTSYDFISSKLII